MPDPLDKIPVNLQLTKLVYSLPIHTINYPELPTICKLTYISNLYFEKTNNKAPNRVADT